MVNSTPNDVYLMIRKRVASGLLSPGMRVSELALSKEFGVSRGPVREAVSRLSGEGLLEHVPSAGTFVKRISRIELEEVYQLRQWIEGEAAAEAAGKISEEQLAELKRFCNEMQSAVHRHRDSGREVVNEIDRQQGAVADLSFHLTLMRACGNRRAVKLLGDQHILSRAWNAAIHPWGLSIFAWSYREHCGILRALQHKDADLARQLMRQHIAGGLRRSLAAIDHREADLTTTETLGIDAGEFEQKLRSFESSSSRDESTS